MIGTPLYMAPEQHRGASVTPVRTKLPVGSHRVRLKNDAKEKTVTVTVTSAKTAVIDETW